MKQCTVAILSVLVLNLASGVTLCSQDFRSIGDGADGVEYAQQVRRVRGADSAFMPCVVNLVRFDGAKASLQLVHAMDAAIGVETTSSLAKRHGAVAAVNAGFFVMKGLTTGDDAGVLKIDGKLLSEPYKERVACGILHQGGRTDVVFGHLQWTGEVEIQKTSHGVRFPISGINRTRDTSEMLLFTPEFHRTTLTTTGGMEVVVQNGIITRLYDGVGSSIIPSDGIVLSCSGAARVWAINNLRVGTKVKITTQLEPLEREQSKGFQAADDIVGGVSQLLKNGNIELTWQREGAAEDFALARHPRTAIARLRDGRILLITVDGRQPGVSAGMTLPELAEMLLEYGAADAMNLDGGGSTTMILRGQAVNKPSDPTGERPVSDALLIFPRSKK